MNKKWKGATALEVVVAMKESSWFVPFGIHEYIEFVASKSTKFTGKEVRDCGADELLEDLVKIGLLYKNGDEYGEK